MRPAGTILTFAYGSNMLSRRLRARVTSARVIGPARLRGHQLRWHKRSRDGSGKCDVVAASVPAVAVHGVVYELALAEKHRLDLAEGLGQGYAQRLAEVETASGRLLAWLYYATDIDPTRLPYTWYRALVVAGAQEHGLPPAYSALIAAAAATHDRNAERHRQHMALTVAG